MSKLSASKNRYYSKHSVMYGPKDKGKEEIFLLKKKARLMLNIRKLMIKKGNLDFQINRDIKKLKETDAKLKRKGL